MSGWFTAESMRRLDRLAVERYGIPSIVLMENAARGAAAIAGRLMRRATAGTEVVIVCGPGNNGGDGFAMARFLHNAVGDSNPVRVVLALGEPKTGDAKLNYDIARAMGIPIERATSRRPLGRSEYPVMVVDAIFGTGLTRPVTSVAASCVRAINAWGSRGVPVLSVDVPSGFDADHGGVVGGSKGVAVRAMVTVTFVGKKRGMRAKDATRWVGHVNVVDIGVPRELVTEAAAWSRGDAGTQRD